MKLNKVNKNGSLSIILPKDVIKNLELQEKQIVELIGSTRNSIVFSINEQEKQPIQNVLNELLLVNESFNDFISALPKDITMDEKVIRDLLKQRLLSILEVI